MICNQPEFSWGFDDKVAVDDTDDVDDFRLIAVVGGGGNTEGEAELLVDGGAIGDNEEEDDEEQLPVDGGSDNGVIIEPVEELFRGTKLKIKSSISFCIVCS